MTDVALDWIRAQRDAPWVLHLSYVKPHWPYLAPAPYHAMFRGADTGPIVRGPQDGTADEHPVVQAYRRHDECESFGREDVARHVRPAYMGLVAQVDAHVGRVMAALAADGPPARHARRVHGRPRRVPRATAAWARRSSSTTRSCACRSSSSIRTRAPTRRAAAARRASSRPSTSCRRSSRRWAAARRRIAARAGACCRCCAARRRTRGAMRSYSELDYGFRRARLVLGRRAGECRGCDGAHGRVEVRGLAGVPAAALRPRARSARVARPGRGARDGRASAPTCARGSATGGPRAGTARRSSDAAIEARTDLHRRFGIHIGIW